MGHVGSYGLSVLGFSVLGYGGFRKEGLVLGIIVFLVLYWSSLVYGNFYISLEKVQGLRYGLGLGF